MLRTNQTVCLSLLCASVCSIACGQQVNVGTPFGNANHSYYENFNIGWGIQGNGFYFSWPGGGAVPPFGGFDPNAQAQFGGSFGGGPFKGGFHISAGQGADTGFVSQSPSVTVMNGGTGYFADVTQRPFVTSYIPIVGGTNYYTPPMAGPSYYSSPLQERLARLRAEGAALRGEATESETLGPAPGAVAPPQRSSAEVGTASVADIRAAQALEDAAQQKEIEDLIAKAAAYEADGKTAVARIIYQQAARRAEGAQRAEIVARIRQLD